MSAASEDEWTSVQDSQALVEFSISTPTASLSGDADSIATEESQWLLLDGDQESDMAPEDIDLLQRADARAREIQPGQIIEDAVVVPDHDATMVSDDEAAESETLSDYAVVVRQSEVSTEPSDDEEDTNQNSVALRTVQVAAKPSEVEQDAHDPVVDMPKVIANEPPAVAAALLATTPIKICGSCAWECDGYRGDVTHQWAPALAGFPDVAGAFCLGRITVNTSSPVLLIARVAVQNSGRRDWPKDTTLRLTAGDALGLGALPIGALPSGHGAELVLDLHTRYQPTAVGGGVGRRSAWVLEDGFGRPFGPLLVLEVIWT